MVADEVTALLTKMIKKLSDVERGLELLRQASWPLGTDGKDGGSNSAVEIVKQTSRRFAAKAAGVARDALLLVNRFEGVDDSLGPGPQKRRTKKRTM